MIKISLVVACFNIEKYISACLDSLLNQDISPNEYEIICVNDCSTDNTEYIIRNYMENNTNIKLINHSKNKKLGAVRNTGRFAAKGRYIWFVDGDDMIKPNVLLGLVSLSEANDLDELLFNHDRINDENIFLDKDNTFIDSETTYTGIEFVNVLFNSELTKLSIVWNHIYRTDYLAENNFLSPEINMGEDAPFAWRTLLFASKVMSISESCYVYRFNETSMTYEFKYKRPSLNKIYEKSILTSIALVELMHDLNHIDEKIVENLYKAIEWNVNSFSTYLLKDYDLSDSKQVYLYFKSHGETIEALSEYFNKSNQGFLYSLSKNSFASLIWRITLKVKQLIRGFLK